MSTELTPAVALAAAEPERERIARIFRNGNGHRQRDAVLRDELLGELVDRLQGRLVRYLTYLVGRRETAEDLAQETWLRVLERGRQYDGRLPFEPWLFAIARHLAIDLLRRRQPGGADLAALDDDGVLALPPAADPSPFEVVASNEAAADAIRAMAALPPIHREALLLRFQEDLPLQDIARLVGTPLTTVSSRIYRALAALRNQLEREAHARRRA